jgi:hypothetical protein
MSNCENHSHHHDLFGEADEMPAVFSGTLAIGFNRNVNSDELCTRLAEWLKALTLWAAHNRCFVGHIKVFAESGEAFHLWLSTTGKGINIRNPHQGSDAAFRQGTVAVTAIVFGTDEENLKTAVMDQWKEFLKRME